MGQIKNIKLHIVTDIKSLILSPDTNVGYPSISNTEEGICLNLNVSSTSQLEVVQRVVLKWNYVQMLFQRPQRIFARCVPERKALGTKVLRFIASSLDSCARVVTSPMKMELVERASTETNF